METTRNSGNFFTADVWENHRCCKKCSTPQLRDFLQRGTEGKNNNNSVQQQQSLISKVRFRSTSSNCEFLTCERFEHFFSKRKKIAASIFLACRIVMNGGTLYCNHVNAMPLTSEFAPHHVHNLLALRVHKRIEPQHANLNLKQPTLHSLLSS